MSEKYPLINGVLKAWPKSGEPMVVTAWTDSLRGSLLFPEHFWRATTTWAFRLENGRKIKALHLEVERVGVDLYLDEGDDPDCVRHMVAAELSAFIKDWTPPHTDCDGPDGSCDACFIEALKEERAKRARGV